MNVKCQCKAVHFTTPLPQPTKLYHCHCTQCRLQSSSAFGTSAIFPLFALPLDTQPLGLFTRPTSNGGTMDCYFCTQCGSRVVHQSRDSRGNLGRECSVKGGVIEGLDWSGGEHIYCEEMVIGSVSIKEGTKKWRRDDDGEVFLGDGVERNKDGGSKDGNGNGDVQKVECIFDTKW